MQVKNEYYENIISWKKSFTSGFSQDSQGSPLPWMTYNFIDFITQKLKPSDEIFEFGCGTSTLFFAKKVARVISLESNKIWGEIINEKLQKQNSVNVEITMMTDALENSSYENFAKNCSKKFDFIIVDSLKRFECIKNSIDALKPSGALILDDSERKNYQKIFEFLQEKNFVAQNFFGIAPGQLRIKNTTIFTR